MHTEVVKNTVKISVSATDWNHWLTVKLKNYVKAKLANWLYN